jgi:hypothetical protein
MKVIHQYNIIDVSTIIADNTTVLMSHICCCDDVGENEVMPWSDWSHKPRALKTATGLSRSMFDRIYTICEDQLIEKRLHSHAGAFKTHHMSTHNMLVITLHWLRKSHSFRSLADLYQPLTLESIRQTVYDIIDILNSHLVPLLIQPIPVSAPSSRMSTLENVRLIIDSTFLPLPKAEKRPEYMHIKSPTKAALKFEIDCDLRHRIVCVSEVVNGAMHDMNIVRRSGILQQMNDNTKAIGDKGYIGRLGIITAARKNMKVSREVSLLQSERERTHELESERSAIENINHRVKQWDIISHIWKQHYSDYTFVNKVVRIVCALVNLTLETHPIRVGRPPLAGR